MCDKKASDIKTIRLTDNETTFSFKSREVDNKIV
jgi:hypothetical protein